MTKSVLSLALLAIAWVLPAMPAQAQTRVFVAAQGSDANPCTFALPCRTFQHAHDTVTANGEIDVLDPAGYGALTITKAISIQGHGYSGISTSGGATAITINAGPNDKINIRGVLLEGFGSGLNGIKLNTGGSLNVQDCMIRNFTNDGINFTPSGVSVLYVVNTDVSDSGNNGITVAPTASAPVTAALDRVSLVNNGNDGFSVNGSGASALLTATIDNSVTARNTNGIHSTSTGATTIVTVRSSTMVGNTGSGLISQSSLSVLEVSRSTIQGNGTGFTAGTGKIVTYSDNIADNNLITGTTSEVGSFR